MSEQGRLNQLSARAKPPLWAGRVVALLGVILAALSLRSGVASLSPLIARVEVEVPMGPTTLGLVGALPALAFGASALFTPAIGRRLGIERLMLIGVVLLTAGLAWRALVHDAFTLALSSGVVFVGIGIANVLMPPIVKRYFPDRVPLITALYVGIASISNALPPLVAEPIAEVAGWRVSLGVWAIVAVLAVVPWLSLRHGHSAPDNGIVEARISLLQVAKSPTAWGIMLVFSMSGITAYSAFAWMPRLMQQHVGVDPVSAGALLAAFAIVGLPSALIVPIFAARRHGVAVITGLSVVCLVTGYLGLIFAGPGAPWLWAVLIGAGPMVFPLALVLVNLRTRTHAGSVAVSGFVQAIGYFIAASAPVVVGLLHERTGGWVVPLWLLAFAAVGIAVGGWLVARNRFIEDELGS
ncbi:MAG TPA: MFS transporter [Candidatus Lumbricidophila sp.]|nr:MFS transporter [Candidatus Lumbricidophila sp.]